MLINLSGRGDKDMGTAIEWFHLGEAPTAAPTPSGARRMSRRPSPSRRRAPRGARPWSATSRPGFPDVDGGIEALRAMVDAGCDVIEVGLPYSDPVMDGPTIQAAAQRRSTGASASATCCAPSRPWPRPARRR